MALFQNPSKDDGGNYIVRAVNEMGDKDCTLALNFGKAVFHLSIKTIINKLMTMSE